VGARPNFMKIAPILDAAYNFPDIHCTLLHTGQHYDERMSHLFFQELGLPKPDIYLGIGSGSHAVQTARVMMEFDRVLNEREIDLVLVVGDVNSTIACALVAVKRGIKVAHVEAGLRSGDRTMPEEINRILTDQISDYLFTTEKAAEYYLIHEGINRENIFFVGNVMIDSLLRHRSKANECDILTRLQLKPKQYAVCTLHRPSNVDTEEAARNMVKALEIIAKLYITVLPLHPRTKSRLFDYNLLSTVDALPNIRIIEPQGYLEFLALMDNAKLVFTDSGGIQEETTVLGVPCFTFRNNTERPITITAGTNHLIGTDPNALVSALDEFESNPRQPCQIPELWDGKAAPRILQIIHDKLDKK